MRRVALLLTVVAVLAAVAIVFVTQDTGQYVEAAGTIIRKEVVDGNQYWLHLEYTIEGYDGVFAASIKLRNRTEYGRYEIGDIYTFRRPVSD